jgi:hypothetical protein
MGITLLRPTFRLLRREPDIRNDLAIAVATLEQAMDRPNARANAARCRKSTV